jgi:hypothetical protein
VSDGARAASLGDRCKKRRGLALGLPAAGVVALAIAAALSACGGIKAPDLFIVQRTGNVAGARLTLLVNEEGGVRCNGGRMLKLSDPALIEARAIQEELSGLASKHLSLPPGPRSVLSYYVRDENGTVSFSDNSSGQPAVLRRLALFVLESAQQVCRLPM